jgi:hypothetical protein
MENTHDQLEHIEHTEHASHDHFNRNVAVTMAIVAAVLAGVTLLSHQAHNETLRLELEASVKKTEAANIWARFQATKIRDYEFRTFKGLDAVAPKDKEALADPEKKAAYEAARKDWLKTDEYKDDLKELETAAKLLDEEVKDLQEESHVYHRRAGRFDLGELFVEMGLVLSSVAILTKRTPFWYSGLAAGALGLFLALSAFLIRH